MSTANSARNRKSASLKAVPALSAIRRSDDDTLPEEYCKIPEIERIVGPGKGEIATGLMNYAQELRELFGAIARVARSGEDEIVTIARMGRRNGDILRNALDRFCIELNEEERAEVTHD
jgi:hypothetical protein